MRKSCQDIDHKDEGEDVSRKQEAFENGNTLNGLIGKRAPTTKWGCLEKDMMFRLQNCEKIDQNAKGENFQGSGSVRKWQHIERLNRLKGLDAPTTKLELFGKRHDGISGDIVQHQFLLLCEGCGRLIGVI